MAIPDKSIRIALIIATALFAIPFVGCQKSESDLVDQKVRQILLEMKEQYKRLKPLYASVDDSLSGKSESCRQRNSDDPTDEDLKRCQDYLERLMKDFSGENTNKISSEKISAIGDVLINSAETRLSARNYRHFLDRIGDGGQSYDSHCYLRWATHAIFLEDSIDQALRLLR